ncbi:tRNA-dihydrouridine synthase 3 [Trichoglossum hirsutum]|uniref:tRNA-dihydrouridine(47) synthase [NAD(P)(+)] n=1 Tax=Trichoglossum hirsutum TaxID=265104 RepID=A0A9P8RMR6_9PEZI|nr:tRNA-dihydrouridine synthase 3 [Trichoglossum hirsutum]
MADQHSATLEQAPADSLGSPASLKRHHDGVLRPDEVEQLHAKRLRADEEHEAKSQGRRKGVVPIKPEFLIPQPGRSRSAVVDDDEAEAARHADARDRPSGRKAKQKGQNVGRDFGSSRDALQLCSTRATYPEFSPAECPFGDGCIFKHDVREYLSKGKRQDLNTFGGVCPVWDARGVCSLGWKCRFAGSHSRERDTEDGRKELVLVEDEERKAKAEDRGEGDEGGGVLNAISTEQKSALMRKKMGTPKTDRYVGWLEQNAAELDQQLHKGDRQGKKQAVDESATRNGEDLDGKESKEDNRAQYSEPPFLPSEKRRIYFGQETPVLAPLTTQGNLPFRRLCVSLGAQLTYSEMAMGMPLIQGNKSEWALMKCHVSETSPPSFKGAGNVVANYENSSDFKFGAQISANKPWLAMKTTEYLTNLCPYLRVIDLNCGCPIDMVYRTGAGSALLENQAKLEKILRGMNAVSGEVPITTKIRMGTKNDRPNALKLTERLVFGGREAKETGGGSAGVAAITLHGRSRQQRYTKSADWTYIAECAALIERFNESNDIVTDTAKEPDLRTKPAGKDGRVYFLGNGDCYSHIDYYEHLRDAKVDSVMLARGALVKPWIFEEIEKNQYLDKSASERLEYIERFARFGLEAWGSDEIGVGTTRKFLLEWMSFAHRYVPLGILEHLPPSLQDRPPAWRGRNDLETLLGSDNYKDWIKIRSAGYSRFLLRGLG